MTPLPALSPPRRQTVRLLRRLTRRRPVALAAMLAMVAVLGGGVAAAAPPIEATSRLADFGCAELTGPDGTAQLVVTASSSHASISLSWWAPGTDPATDPPTLIGVESDQADVTWDGMTVTGTTPLVDAQGQPAGEAAFTAELTEAGPVETDIRRESSGNVRTRFTSVQQPITAAGTLQLSGDVSFTFTGCAGHISTYTSWRTDPDASVYQDPTAVTFTCPASGPDGSTLDVVVEASLESSVVLTLVPAGSAEPSLVGYTLTTEMTHAGVTATVPLLTLPELEPAGDATLSVSLHRTGHRRFLLDSQDGRKTLTVEQLAVEGTVTFPDGTVFTLDDCTGERNTAREIVTDSNAESASGPAPANDTLETAVPLAAGTARNDQTGAAAPAAEVPLWCHETEPLPEELTGHTLWYQVEGTGSAMTVDTAGSSFNTVLGVYVRDGDALVEVACVDDLFGDTLQARATVTTEVGTTYLIQVGGFAGQFGRLRISVE